MAPKGKRTKITGGIKYDPLIDTTWSKNMPLHLFDTKEQVTSKAIESSSMPPDVTQYLLDQGYKKSDIDFFINQQFWPSSELIKEVKPDIQTVKEKVNLDLEMGDINLIGDKRVTTADTLLKDNKSQREIDLDNVMTSENKSQAVADFKNKYNIGEAFKADDVRYVSENYYNIDPKETANIRNLRKIVSEKNLELKPEGTAAEKIAVAQKKRWEEGVLGTPEHLAAVGQGAKNRQQKLAAMEIDKINKNPELMTASYIDSIKEPPVKNLVRNEFSHLFPDLYHGKFESKTAEQAFKGLQKIDPEISFHRGHLIQKMLAGEVKGVKTDRPQFPTESKLNNFHDVFNSFLDQAKIKREKAITEQRWDDVKIIESNMDTVKSFITELFLESPIKGQKKTDIISPYPEGASIQHKINVFKENYKDAINKLPEIKEKFYDLRNKFDKLNLNKGGYVQSSLASIDEVLNGI